MQDKHTVMLGVLDLMTHQVPLAPWFPSPDGFESID